MKIKRTSIAPMEAASPDLEKQGFFAVVFIYREYSIQRDDSCGEQRSGAPRKNNTFNRADISL